MMSSDSHQEVPHVHAAGITTQDLRVRNRQGRRRNGHCCSAMWCHANSRNSTASFFRFPKDDRCEAWIEFVERKELAEAPRKKLNGSLRLCSLHFKDEDFTNPGRTRLNWNAVPSVKEGIEGEHIREARPRTLFDTDVEVKDINQAISSEDAELPSRAISQNENSIILDTVVNDEQGKATWVYVQSPASSGSPNLKRLENDVVARPPVRYFKRRRHLRQHCRRRSSAPEIDWKTTIPEPLELSLSAEQFFLLGETCGPETNEMTSEREDCSNSDSGSMCVAEGMDYFSDEEDVIATRTVGLQTEESDTGTTTFSSFLCHMTRGGVATEVAHEADNSAPTSAPSSPRQEPRMRYISYIVY